MYVNLFPKFKVVEINRSTALTAGHVIAQYPASVDGIAHKEVATYDDEGNSVKVNVLENGVICGLSYDAEIVNYDSSKCAQPCLIMNDELPTSPLEGLDQYFEEFEDGVVYPRVLPLYVGDSFTTNNFDASGATSPAYAKVVDGILTLEDSHSDESLFKVESSRLPAGQSAYHFVFIGK